MSDHIDKKTPALKMTSYPETKKLQSAHQIRPLAVDFNNNCVKLIDLAAQKEDAAVRRRVMFGTPRPIIHTKVKRATTAAEPKDVDADWEIINQEDLGAEEKDTLTTLAADKDSDDDYVVVVSGRMEKSKAYTAGLAQASRQTSK